MVLLIVRLSTAYALIASALFSGGVFANHLNSTLPVVIVLLLGIALAAGLFPRWTMGIVFLWLLYVVATNLGGKGVLRWSTTARIWPLHAPDLVLAVAVLLAVSFTLNRDGMSRLKFDVFGRRLLV